MAKKESGNSIVPQEYVDKMQELDVEAWRKQKIADALKYQESRETGAGAPSWWGGGEKDPFHSEVYGHWNNCLATATGAFGDKYCESGNKTFINPKSVGYFKKKGFRELTDSDEDEYGDIWVDYGYEGTGIPYHALMLTNHDENGVPLFTYGTGVNDHIQKNKHYPNGGIYKKYRFVGSPEDIAEIEAHNSRVREYNKKTAPLREEREVPLLETEPLDNKKMTADWLKTLPKRK